MYFSCTYQQHPCQNVNLSKMHTHIQCMFLKKAQNECTNRIVIINLCIMVFLLCRANAELHTRRKKSVFLYELYEGLIWFRSGGNFTKRWAGFQSELAFTHLLTCAESWLDFLKASPFFLFFTQSYWPSNCADSNIYWFQYNYQQ